MLRNREIRVLFAVLAGISAASVAAGFAISKPAGLLATISAALFCAVIVMLTRWRYRQIALLSAQLKRINSGDYGLDLREEAEGELSVLKSELYKTTVMLREQNEQLRRDKSALQGMLTDISHQLKTPLTSMFVMTDLLCEEDLPQDRRAEFTGRIRSQLERMQWLVTSLLKLSRLDAGAVRFRREEVPARDVCERACAPLLIPMELKNQTLTIDDGGTTLRCDAPWTAEAVLNILKNCVEHTPPGGSIRIRCADNPLHGLIRVEDSGPGIDPEDLPNIFNRFYRGRNAHEDSVGIGLALAASIVQSQSGSIEAGRGNSGGSVFTLRFPK